MSEVTVIAPDNLIIFDGIPLTIPNITFPEKFHALHWYDNSSLGIGFGSGYTEETLGPNHQIGPEDFLIQVYPYIRMWYEEYERIKMEELEAEQKRLEIYNSEEARFERLREAMKMKLGETDYLVTLDYYPLLTKTSQESIIAYRDAVRTLDHQEGAPWDGGGEETPWPEAPIILKRKEGIVYPDDVENKE